MRHFKVREIQYPTNFSIGFKHTHPNFRLNPLSMNMLYARSYSKTSNFGSSSNSWLPKLFKHIPSGSQKKWGTAGAGIIGLSAAGFVFCMIHDYEHFAKQISDYEKDLQKECENMKALEYQSRLYLYHGINKVERDHHQLVRKELTMHISNQDTAFHDKMCFYDRLHALRNKFELFNTAWYWQLAFSHVIVVDKRKAWQLAVDRICLLKEWASQFNEIEYARKQRRFDLAKALSVQLIKQMKTVEQNSTDLELKRLGNIPYKELFSHAKNLLGKINRGKDDSVGALIAFEEAIEKSSDKNHKNLLVIAFSHHVGDMFWKSQFPKCDKNMRSPNEFLKIAITKIINILVDEPKIGMAWLTLGWLLYRYHREIGNKDNHPKEISLDENLRSFILDELEGLKNIPEFEEDKMLNIAHWAEDQAIILQENSDESKDNNLSPNAYMIRGYINLALKNEEAALNDFNKVLSLVPDYPIAWQKKGFIYFQQARRDLRAYQKGILKTKKPALEKLLKAYYCDEWALILYTFLYRYSRGQPKYFYDTVKLAIGENVTILRPLSSVQYEKEIVKWRDNQLEMDNQQATLFIYSPGVRAWQWICASQNFVPQSLPEVKNDADFVNVIRKNAPRQLGYLPKLRHLLQQHGASLDDPYQKGLDALIRALPSIKTLCNESLEPLIIDDAIRDGVSHFKTVINDDAIARDVDGEDYAKKYITEHYVDRKDKDAPYSPESYRRTHLMSYLNIDNIPSIMNYLELCSRAYNPQFAKELTGWTYVTGMKEKIYHQLIDPKKFQAVVYQHQATGQIVFAYGGTSLLNYGHLKADWAIFNEVTPRQFNMAVDFVTETIKNIENDSEHVNATIDHTRMPIIHTGHSLGGAIANYLACRNEGNLDDWKIRAITFDSPGVNSQIQDYWKEVSQKKSTKTTRTTAFYPVTRFVVRPNVVNTCGRFSGQTYQFFLPTDGLDSNRENIVTKQMYILLKDHALEKLQASLEINHSLPSIVLSNAQVESNKDWNSMESPLVTGRYVVCQLYKSQRNDTDLATIPLAHFPPKLQSFLSKYAEEISGTRKNINFTKREICYKWHLDDSIFSNFEITAVESNDGRIHQIIHYKGLLTSWELIAYLENTWYELLAMYPNVEDRLLPESKESDHKRKTFAIKEFQHGPSQHLFFNTEKEEKDNAPSEDSKSTRRYN